MNSALIDRSPRLQCILKILKEGVHPLSSEEISIRAYDFYRSGKIMLNISTNIGEMRSEQNREAGYIVSEATAWKSDPENPNLPWRDGRPRYWLIAAPGWAPKWTMTREGLLVPYTERQGQMTMDEGRGDGGAGRHGDVDAEPRRCRLKSCGKKLAEDKKLEAQFCNDDCRAEFWRQIKMIGQTVAERMR